MQNALTYHDYENIIVKIKRICNTFHIDSLNQQIVAINEVIHESNVINVVLLGRFKSGKSSFLNSILGQNIIPVGILPLTAVITRVRYGVKDKAEVLFLNGQVKDITFSELVDFISEEGNPENVKKIARADLELSCLLEYLNIQFVDTPGLGSVHIHNNITTKDWLPRVGVAFLMISIDHPLSENDITLLKELETHTSEINIILTKIDLVSYEEVNRVIGFIQTQVRQKLNRELRIFPVSNKPGYETVRSAVYEYIRRSIGDQQVSKSIEIIYHKFGSITSGCHKYLLLGLSMATANQESRQQLYQQLQQERHNLLIIENEIKLIASDIESRLRTDLYEKFQEQYSQVKVQLVKKLKEQMPYWKGNHYKTSVTFRKWLEDSLVGHLVIVSEKIGPRLSKEYLDTALTSYTRIVRAFQDRLAQDIEKALHTNFSGANFEVKIEKPKQPDIHIDYVLISPLELLFWFGFPMWLFRTLVNRQFMHQVPEEIGKNLSRLSSQWVEAIICSINNIAQQAVEFIKDEITTIESILAEAFDNRKDIEKAILELEIIKSSFRE